METKRRLILRHIDSGMYISWSPDNMPLTPKLLQARRFSSAADIALFYETSPYRPENPGDYEIVDMKITYELEDNGNGTNASA